MKLIAIMPVRNEDWVLGLSARAALMWCDELIMLDHASNDATVHIAREIMGEHPGRLFLLHEQDPQWQEMKHRNLMLESARIGGATHIALVDADEVLTGNLLPSIRGHVESLAPGHILQLPGYNLRGSITRYHANGIWGDRLFSLAFKDDGKANWQGDTFHHREPFGFPNQPSMPVAQGQGGIMHLWGADERRLIAKHALYKMTERLRWPNKPVAEIDRAYSLAIYPQASVGTRFTCQWRFSEAPGAWWWPYRDLMQYLDLSAEPWQELECQRLWCQHGAARFAGLDLFGVVKAARGAA